MADIDNLNFFNHYKNILFFALKRYKSNNYTLMREYFASIFIYDISNHIKIEANLKIIDVGGSTGEFSKFLGENYKCDVINLDPFKQNHVWKTINAEAHNMPVEDDYFNLVLFRGVMEHIEPKKQQASLDEIFRIMKNNGYGYFVIPPWFNPHAGHGLKPFHIFPFKLAKFLRNLFFNKKVKYNSLEEASLYKITFKKMKKMIEKSGFEIIDMKDTHLRFHFLCRIPILREFLVPAVAFIVKK
tara:strand:- start:5642 stop:6370 length:729 start_codon:yes stop_codon:yes gene_type:complete